MAYEKNMNYAGFWKRFAAFFIDYLILFIPSVILQKSYLMHLEFIYEDLEFIHGDAPAFLISYMLLNIAIILMQWIYFAAFASSSKQATPGKMALGIKVTDLNGRRIGFGKATGQYFGMLLSMAIFFVGCIMIAFTEKKQGLHDKMAGCLVVNK